MFNRDALFETLRHEIARAQSSSKTLAVLILRTRRLREINLLFGYEVGEAFVDAVENVVAGALRAQDEVRRIGEDGFVVILPGLRDRNHAALAAAKLVRALQVPIGAAGQRVLPVISVGIATSPEDAAEPHALCRHADQACEDANRSNERFAFYQSPRMTVNFVHGDLRDAIAGNRLELFLQPIANLGGDRIDRCEALARWTHPTLGAVSPEVFVRVAEQTGLIWELTRWGLNVALRCIAGSGPELPLSIAVNIAVDAFQQPGFVEQVTDQLRFWNVPPDRLVLEITESGLMSDLQHCEQVLGQLRNAGVGIAIDDFGTGYSSMAYLRRLPANELKIDRSFVQDMLIDPRAEKLVASMIDVSHHLGMTTVAEGVEDPQTLELLRAMGCDFAQGLHIARPAPAAQVLAALTGRASS